MKMRVLITVVLFSMFAIAELFAQGKQAVYFELNYNKSDYSALADKSGNRGITADAFAQWIVNNGQIRVKAEGLERGEMPGKGALVVYSIDERGSITGEQRISVRIPDRFGSLNSLLSSGELARALKSMYPDSVFYPGFCFLPRLSILS